MDNKSKNLGVCTKINFVPNKRNGRSIQYFVIGKGCKVKKSFTTTIKISGRKSAPKFFCPDVNFMSKKLDTYPAGETRADTSENFFVQTLDFRKSLLYICTTIKGKWYGNCIVQNG